MQKHYYTDTTKVNFDKLEERLCAINDPLFSRVNVVKNLLKELISDMKPVLIVATGGSKVVANYLDFILDGVISRVIEPRDYFYMKDKNNYSNLVVISASGTSNGVKEIIDDFKGKKYLLTQKYQDLNCEVVTWGNELYENEKSFISLASSLGPISLLLQAKEKTNINSSSIDIETTNVKIKRLIELASSRFMDNNFKDISLLQVLSGYDTNVCSSALESNIVESGICPIVIHDKGSYCHGRSNLLYNYQDSNIVYLLNKETELDRVILNVLSEEYSNLEVIDSLGVDDNLYWKQFYMLIQMYYLSKKIAEDRNIDLTQPEYNKNVVRKLYKYRGIM